MPATPLVAHYRAQKARAVQAGDRVTADRADRALRAQLLEEHIRRVVDAWPPLTVGQRERLSNLLTR